MPIQEEGQTARVNAVVKNSAGIHCRPTALIVKAARQFDDDIIVRTGEELEGDPKSAIELLALGLDKGTKVEIVATDPKAQEAVAALAPLFETEFDFAPRNRDTGADDIMH